MIRKPMLLAASLAAALAASADSVTLKDGSVLNGTITSISGGSIQLQTSFAGTVSISQTEVVAFSTDAPIAVKTSDDNIVRGTVSGKDGTLRVAAPGGTLATSVDQVKSAWSASGNDPEVLALRRKWIYQVDVDLSGKSGNSSRFSTGVGGSATLSSAEDALKLYSSYNYSRQDGAISEDTFTAGADYNSYFSEKASWFVFGEGGFDEIKGLDLRLRTGAGLGYAMIKNSKQVLTTRLGLAYRYEDYAGGDANDVSSPGLDVGLLHTYDFGKYGTLNQSVTYTPAFNDFGNYVINHDSALTLPGGDWWNLRVGLRTDYSSEPPPGTGNWDITYYVKMGMFWR